MTAIAYTARMRDHTEWMPPRTPVEVPHPVNREVYFLRAVQCAPGHGRVERVMGIGKGYPGTEWASKTCAVFMYSSPASRSA